MIEGICNSCGRRYRLAGATRPFACRYCEGIVYQHDPDAVAVRKPSHLKLTKGQTVAVEISEAYLLLIQILLWASAAYKTFDLGQAVYAFLRYERNVLGAILVLSVTSIGIGILVTGALRVRSRPLLWCVTMTVLMAAAILLGVETKHRALPPPNLLNLAYLTAFVLGIAAALIVRNQPLPRSQWAPRDLKAARIIQMLTVAASGIILLAAGAIYEHKLRKAPIAQRVSEALAEGMTPDIQGLGIEEFVAAWNSADSLERERAMLERFILPKAQPRLVPRYLASFERYGWGDRLPTLKKDPRARGGRDQVMAVFFFENRPGPSQLVTIWSPDDEGKWWISKLFREDVY